MHLRVYTVPPLVMEGAGRYIDKITARVRQEAEEYLNRVSSSLGNLGVPVSVAVGEGQAASIIVDQA